MYTPADADGDAEVVSWNHRFLQMYNIEEHTAKSVRLTLVELMKRLYGPDKQTQLVEETDWQEFLADQMCLTRDIVFRGEKTRHGDFPIKFKHNHPSAEFAGKSMLPCLIAKRVVGDTSRPHSMYLVVIHVEQRAAPHPK